jgi:anti-anti-sigma regulatory factor
MHAEILSVDGGFYSGRVTGPITEVFSSASPIEHDGVDVLSKKLILDLSGADAIDSTGVGWIIGCHKRASKRGGTIVFHSPEPLVQRAFDLMRISQTVHISANLNAAKKLVKRL